MARVNGTVKFFNHARGFGFIQPEDGGKDVFVHASALERSGVPALNEGDKVSFEIEDDRPAPELRVPGEIMSKIRLEDFLPTVTTKQK